MKLKSSTHSPGSGLIQSPNAPQSTQSTHPMVLRSAANAPMPDPHSTKASPKPPAQSSDTLSSDGKELKTSPKMSYLSSSPKTSPESSPKTGKSYNALRFPKRLSRISNTQSLPRTSPTVTNQHTQTFYSWREWSTACAGDTTTVCASPAVLIPDR